MYELNQTWGRATVTVRLMVDKILDEDTHLDCRIIHPIPQCIYTAMVSGRSHVDIQGSVYTHHRVFLASQPDNCKKKDNDDQLCAYFLTFLKIKISIIETEQQR